MAIQLTPEQEKRINAVVSTGAYSSTEQAIDAALAAVETAATGFDGTQEDLDELLLDGLTSGEPVEADEAFWSHLTTETDRMIGEHQVRKPIRES